MSAMDESVILHAERSFLVCRKPVGVECEHLIQHMEYQHMIVLYWMVHL